MPKRKTALEKELEKLPPAARLAAIDAIEEDLSHTVTDEEFARAINAVARQNAKKYGPRKAFISSVHSEAQKRFPSRFKKVPLPEFKRKLIQAHKQGRVTLSRADLTAAMDPTDVRDSEIQHLEARYNFIEPGDE